MNTRPGRALTSLYVRAKARATSDERGAEMAEYGMLIFFVGIAGFGILVLFGGEVWEMFGSAEAEFDSARKIPPAAD